MIFCIDKERKKMKDRQASEVLYPRARNYENARYSENA